MDHDRMVDPDYYKEILDQENERKYWRKYITENNVLEFDCDQNPCYDGNLFIKEITFQFDEVKECYYRGYSYFLPVINGKSKRIKNKTIRITDFEILDIDNLIVKINNLEIVKK